MLSKNGLLTSTKIKFEFRQYYSLHNVLLPIFLEQIRKMKRDNQRGTTVFHQETFDAKIEPSICTIYVTKYVNYTRMVRCCSA